MSQSVEITGKSVDDAVKKALEELHASEDQVSVEVLEEESGFLGIGSKATVRVTKNPTLAEPTEVNQLPVEAVEEETVSVETSEEPVESEIPVQNEAVTAELEEEEKSEEELTDVAVNAIRDFLQEIVNGFGLADVNEVTVDSEDNRIVASIDGEDCGILIGRRGETLNALQYLCSLVANRSTHSRKRVSLDIGGYKAKRENSVSSLAVRTAQRAIRTGQAFELTPMNAAERRVVHETLQDFEGIVTYSEGDEPNRYVVIDLAYEDEVFEPETEQE